MTSRRNHRGRAKTTSEEYCRGFVDKHGQWNNGFYCPRWGGPDRQYCCGPEDNKYCCPKQEVEEKLHDNQAQQISLLIGLAVGSIILLIGATILSCFFCHCCWAYKRRKRLQNPPQLPAYPGLSRDSSDPVNYAMCPHGTIFPEFMVSAPQYPNEAPPPYPGDESALRLTHKQSLPPPSVYIENRPNLRQETNVDGHHIEETITADTEGGSRLGQCINRERTNSSSQSVVEGTSLQSAVIPHRPRAPSSCRSEPNSSSRRSSPHTLPSTSHLSRCQIPKYKRPTDGRAGARHHAKRRGHRCGRYDSRSLSSTDSDSCTG